MHIRNSNILKSCCKFKKEKEALQKLEGEKEGENDEKRYSYILIFIKVKRLSFISYALKEITDHLS